MFQKTRTLSFATVFSLCLLVCPAFAGAQTHHPETVKTKAADPQNVLDYYLLLPNKELGLLENTKKSREALIQDQDVANGYLALSSDELQGVAQVALFRKKTCEAVIGLTETEQTVISSGSVKFLQYSGGQWRDVTAEVWPEIGAKEILAAYNRIKKGDDEEHTLQKPPHIYWELPKKGTTVEMRSGEDSASRDKALMKFTWNGARFTKQAK
jgi:hypothetical protein